MLHSFRGGGHSTFMLVLCAAQRAGRRGLWTDRYRIWDPRELNFLTKCSLVNWNLPQFEALELNSLLILKLWSLKFLKIHGFWGEIRVLRAEKCWNGGLANGREGVKRGSSWQHISIPHFSGSAPWHGLRKAYSINVVTHTPPHKWPKYSWTKKSYQLIVSLLCTTLVIIIFLHKKLGQM